MPLPWLLGSILATALLSPFGFELSIYKPLRMLFLTIIGVLLGSSFTPAFIANAGHNVLTMVLLVPYTLLATMLVFGILLRTTALDRATAFFSAVPGGVNEMTLLGAERGGHEPSLAVHQSLRLLLVILTVSTIFGLYGVSAVGRADLVEPVLTWSGYGWILAMAGGGAAMAMLVHLPAPFILGPMLVSAVLHLIDFVDVKPGTTLVAVAQLVSGAAIGSQFSNFSRRMLYSAGVTAAGIAALLLVFTAAFAFAISFIVDQPFPVLLLAFAPGGMGEMGLIALAMNADAAFVSASQVFRFFVVVTMAAPLYGFFQARMAPSSDSDGP